MMMVRPEELEPPAYRFEACRSIQLSYGRAEVGDILSRSRVPARGVDRARTGEPADRYARIRCLPRRGLPRRSTATSPFGPVAQLAEQQTLNLRVVGSIPTRLTSLIAFEVVDPRGPQALRLRSSTSPFGHDSHPAHQLQSAQRKGSHPWRRIDRAGNPASWRRRFRAQKRRCGRQIHVRRSPKLYRSWHSHLRPLRHHVK